MVDSLQDLAIEFVALHLHLFTTFVEPLADISQLSQKHEPHTENRLLISSNEENSVFSTTSSSNNIPPSSTICSNCQRVMHFIDPLFVLPDVLAEKLLQALDLHGLLNDDTFTLFNSDLAKLVHVKVRNSPLLTQRSLARLRGHRLRSLQITNLTEVSTNTILGCIGDSCWRCLQKLDVSGVSLLCDKLPVVVGLSRFKELRFLNVSNSEFDSKCLGVVCDDLPHLSGLNISHTPVQDLTPLLKVRHRLNALHLYRVRPSSAERFIDLLSQLRCLWTLDISDDHIVTRLSRPACRERLQQLFCSADFLPHLTHLDVSGNKLGLQQSDILAFIKTHPQLSFLGLAVNEDEHSCAPNELQQPAEQRAKEYQHIIVSGEDNEAAMIESLKRYSDRPPYMQRTLYHLFMHTNGAQHGTEHLLRLVFPAMREHPRNLSVQLAATAVLYNLTKGPHCERITKSSLNQAVRFTMSAMENFPKHAQLQKNSLLTLCSDTVLHQAVFDRCRCSRLVFESLCAHREAHMTRMAAAIVSILAAKVDTRELRELAQERRYVRRLLGIVRDKTEVLSAAAASALQQVAPTPADVEGAGGAARLGLRHRGQEPAAVAVCGGGGAAAFVAEGPPLPPPQLKVDTAMRFTLSALWNLTDECSEASAVFVEEGGLDVYQEVFRVFQNDESEDKISVFTKMLGLLNNVAEVIDIRRRLLRPSFVARLTKLLLHVSINISYFAAGILSHLLCDSERLWNAAAATQSEAVDVFVDKEACLQLLKTAVLNWDAPEADMVAYRSFRPFAALLHQRVHMEVHLWALWAIDHVCQRDHSRYLPYLLEWSDCGTGADRLTTCTKCSSAVQVQCKHVWRGRLLHLISALMPADEHCCANCDCADCVDASEISVKCGCATCLEPTRRLRGLAHRILTLAERQRERSLP